MVECEHKEQHRQECLCHMTAVDIRGVWKFYGDYPALKDISLNVNGGSCLALIGRNGAGKTTPLRILAGLSKAAKGNIAILGPDAPHENSPPPIAAPCPP